MEILTNPNYLKAYKELGQPFVLTNGKAFLMNPKKIINNLKENDIKSVSIFYHFGIQDDLSPIKMELKI